MITLSAEGALCVKSASLKGGRMVFVGAGASLSHPCSPASEKNGVAVNVLQAQRKISVHSVCYQTAGTLEGVLASSEYSRAFSFLPFLLSVFSLQGMGKMMRQKRMWEMPPR